MYYQVDDVVQHLCDPLEEDYDVENKENRGVDMDLTDDVFYEADETENFERNNETSYLQRSLSLSGLHYFETAMERMSYEVPSEEDRGIPRTISMESLNRLAQPKRHYHSQQSLNAGDYVPFAEAVRSFPDYLHHRSIENNCARGYKRMPTIPQSPFLISSMRTRPVTALTHEELELREFEEARKNKFKANPLNSKVLEKPKHLGPSNEHKITVPEPFQLTEVKPKLVVEEEKPVFHAKPAPNFAKNAPPAEVFLKKPAQTKKAVPESSKPVEKGHVKKIRPLSPSFELRCQELVRRKEQFVKRELEKERKAREFRARAIPPNLLKSANASINSERSVSSQNSETVQFKARPPKVLGQKPFVPKKIEKPITAVKEFQLHTNERVRAWQEFNEILQTRENNLATQRKIKEEKERQKEEEEIKRLREMSVYTAQPVRKYKPVETKPANKVTAPKTPEFMRRAKK